MTPACEVPVGTLKEVEQASSFTSFSENHGKRWQEISIKFLIVWIGKSLKILSQMFIVTFQELERSWNTGHCLCWAPNNFNELFQTSLIIGQQEFNVVIDFFLQFFVFDALNRNISTRSSYFCSFFFYSTFLVYLTASDIQKIFKFFRM